MNYRGNNNECDICCGRTKCSYCGNVPREIPKREFTAVRWSKNPEFWELEFVCGEITKTKLDHHSEDFKQYLDLTTVRIAHTAPVFFCCDDTYESIFGLNEKDLVITTGVNLLNGNFHQKNIVAIKRGVVHEISCTNS
jgi:hypothetical protein